MIKKRNSKIFLNNYFYYKFYDNMFISLNFILFNFYLFFNKEDNLIVIF